MLSSSVSAPAGASNNVALVPASLRRRIHSPLQRYQMSERVKRHFTVVTVDKHINDAFPLSPGDFVVG